MKSTINKISHKFCRLGSFAVFTMIGSFVSLPLVQENQIDYSLLSLFGSIIVGTVGFTTSAILDFNLNLKNKQTISEKIMIQRLDSRKEPKIIFG